MLVWDAYYFPTDSNDWLAYDGTPNLVFIKIFKFSG